MSDSNLFYNIDLLDAPPGLVEVFDKMRKEHMKAADEQRKAQVREILECLDYVYIHGDKYVAIKDIIDLF